MTGVYTFALGTGTRETTCAFCGENVFWWPVEGTETYVEVNRTPHLPRCRMAERTGPAGDSGYRRRSCNQTS